MYQRKVEADYESQVFNLSIVLCWNMQYSRESNVIMAIITIANIYGKSSQLPSINGHKFMYCRRIKSLKRRTNIHLIQHLRDFPTDIAFDPFITWFWTMFPIISNYCRFFEQVSYGSLEQYLANAFVDVWYSTPWRFVASSVAFVISSLRIRRLFRIRQ